MNFQHFYPLLHAWSQKPVIWRRLALILLPSLLSTAYLFKPAPNTISTDTTRTIAATPEPQKPLRALEESEIPASLQRAGIVAHQLSFQNQTIKLRLEAPWVALGEWLHSLGRSAHYPERYEFRATESTVQAQMVLHSGLFQADTMSTSVPLLFAVSAEADNPVNNSEPPSPCTQLAPPPLFLVANWPLRGYIVMRDSEGVLHTVHRGQLLPGGAWKLADLQAEGIEIANQSLPSGCARSLRIPI